MTRLRVSRGAVRIPRALLDIAFAVSLAVRTSPAGSLVVAVSSIVLSSGGLAAAIWVGFIADAAHADAWRLVGLLCAGAGATVMVALLALTAGFQTRMRLKEEVEFAADQIMIDLVARAPSPGALEAAETRDKIDFLRTTRGRFGSALDETASLFAVMIQFVISVLLLAGIAPVLMLLPLFALPAALAAEWAAQRRGQVRFEASKAARVARTLEAETESLVAAAELRLFGLQDLLSSKHRKSWSRSNDVMDAIDARTSLVICAAWTPFFAALAYTLITIVDQAAAGRSSIGELATATLLALQVSGHMQAGLSQWLAYGDILRTVGALRDLSGDFEALERQAAERPSHLYDLGEGIRFEAVGFRYPNGVLNAVEGLDFVLPPASTIAVVGENGAGKSTLVKLLTGLLEPTAGRIRVGGVDLQAVPAEEWRSKVTAVFQDFGKFELPAQQSVGVGNLDQAHDPGRVQAALRASGQDEVPAWLPEGLATPLGRSCGGYEPSMGQWQSLAIARAAMRPAAWLTVLDEPTASLDPVAEQALFRRYMVMGREGGFAGVKVIVTHRLTAARYADLILVLKDGRLSEWGDHAALLRQGGHYADLFHVQARQFQLDLSA